MRLAVPANTLISEGAHKFMRENVETLVMFITSQAGLFGQRRPGWQGEIRASHIFHTLHSAALHDYATSLRKHLLKRLEQLYTIRDARRELSRETAPSPETSMIERQESSEFSEDVRLLFISCSVEQRLTNTVVVGNARQV